jgi:trans-aconitate methyltransferase
MDWDAKTIATYDNSAEALAEYFKGIGARVTDIELGLSLASAVKKAKVVEIGCGDGRDAVEIIKRVGWYEGFDPSKSLLEIAKQRLPEGSFVLADALSYNYPPNTDVIYAFASLLHVNKTNMPKVFEKATQSLRQGGLFYISLKERDGYQEDVKKDTYGERMFYYYDVDTIKEIAGDAFTAVHEDHQVHGNTDWFTLALKKV